MEAADKVIPLAKVRKSLKVAYRQQGTKLGLFASVILFVVLWEILATYILKFPLILVGPLEVGALAVELLNTGELPQHLYVSAIELLWGFSTALAAGIVVGVLTGATRFLRTYLDPWISGLYSVPIIALAPLLIVWFGIGLFSKVIFIFAICFFPVAINTLEGVKSIPSDLTDVARSFKVSRSQMFVKVMIPAVLPFIVAGARLSYGRGLIAVFVSEMFGSSAGVGFLIIRAGQIADTAALLLGVVILAISGVAGTEMLKFWERRLAPWRKEIEEE